MHGVSAEVTRRKELDKGKKLHPSKVRAVVICEGCGRPRCIFAELMPSKPQLQRLDAYLECVNFTCGDALFPEGVEGADKKLADVFYNAVSITCRDEMELSYFNHHGLRGRAEFEHVCARCGKSHEESALVDKPKLPAPAGKRALPLCSECFADGKGKGPVLVGRSDKVSEELERKATKSDEKRKAAEEKAAAPAPFSQWL